MNRRKYNYLAMTVHTFVDCIVQSMLLHFALFKGSHTGTRIAAEIEKTLNSYNLTAKVVHIISDNTSNMKAAFRILAELDAADGDTDSDKDHEANVIQDDVVDNETLFEDLVDEDADDVTRIVGHY